MIYWILQETLGYSYGTVLDEKNVPAGAKVLRNENQLNNQVKAAEKNLEKELNDFFIDEPAKLQAQLDKEFKDKNPPGQDKKDEEIKQNERRRNNG